MATIGNTDVGTQDYTLSSSDRAYSIEITMPEGGGIPTSVHAYIERGGSGTDPQIKGVIWDASDGSVLEVGSVADISSTGWQEVTFTSADKISAGTIVYVGFVFNRPGSPYGYIYSNVSGYDGKYDGSNSFSSPQTFDNIVNYSEMSIYLTYTPFRCGTYEITLDSTKVDSDLTHFPVPIFLNSTAGSGDDDVTAIFDFLGSNSKKIKVFDSDWEQLYVEIEHWDNTGEEAVLWVSRSDWTVASGTDTTIYLQYDADMADNDEYVGDVGSRTEVWDSDFAGVWHMDSSITDSTSNNNDGSATGTTDGSGAQGTYQTSDGTNTNRIDVSDLINDISSATVGTIHAYSNHTDDNDDQMIFGFGCNDGSNKTEIWCYYDLRNEYDRLNIFGVVDSSTKWNWRSDDNFLDSETGSYHHFALTQDATEPTIFWDGEDITSSDGTWNNETDKTVWFKDIFTDATKDANTCYVGNLPRYNVPNGAWAYNGDYTEFRVSTTNRSGAWIKAEYNSLADSLIKEFATWNLPAESWLGTWAKRVEITVDETNIDECLSHFPVPIFLSSSCGQSNEDLTPVFDEVGSSYQKIAVTEADGQTQLFVEVEHWDDSGEEAVLWVSRDSWFIPASGTNMYLYFDSAQANNTDYVGDVASAVGQNVWDDDFMAVWHLSESGDGTTDEFKDSTNTYHGTGDASHYPDRVTGKVGYAQEFDYANSEYIRIDTDINAAFPANNYTMEMWWESDDPTPGAYLRSFSIAGSSENFQFCYRYADIYVRVDNTRHYTNDNCLINADTWRHVTICVDSGGTVTAFVDNVESTVNTGSGPTSNCNVSALGGTYQDNSLTHDGMQDEIRISTGVRSNAWIQANYYAQTDDLLDFGTVEEYPTAGWGHKIYGIASGSFTKIYGVDVGNITKVCGVE